MSTRRINQLLTIATVVLIAAATVMLLCGVLVPVRSHESAESRSQLRASANYSSLPPLADLEPIWALRLQSDIMPNVAPAPEESRIASPGAPGTTPLTLVGTIGESLALLADSSGMVEVKAVGETWGDVEIVEVRPSRVQVRYNGQVVTLEKLPEPDGS